MKQYEQPEMWLEKFAVEDVIATSVTDPGEGGGNGNDTPFAPFT